MTLQRRVVGLLLILWCVLASAAQASVSPRTESLRVPARAALGEPGFGGISGYDGPELGTIGPHRGGEAGVSSDFYNYDGLVRSVRGEFTAKHRDYESGLKLDYFGARYYAGAMGRFASADKPFNDQFAADPQSWNLFSYVRNNPFKFVDPDGEQLQPVIQRLVQVASRYQPQIEKVGRSIQRHGRQIATTAADIAFGEFVNTQIDQVNAATLMQEHPGLSQENALAAVETPIGTVAVAKGAGRKGADVEIYSSFPTMSGPVLQREVKVSSMSKFGYNLSAAAGQLGSQGGTALMQVPKGTNRADVERKMKGFRNVPGRDLSKYERVRVEVRDEDGNVLYSGDVTN